MDTPCYTNYMAILREELVAAQGCTEPIALSLAAAKAKEVLGVFPDFCLVECSGNIIKNVKSVVVPGTKGLCGIEAAVLAGLVAGRSELKMEVLTSLTPEDVTTIKYMMGKGLCEIVPLLTDEVLHIRLSVSKGSDKVVLEIKSHHTNIVQITKNGEVVFQGSNHKESYLGTLTDRSKLSVASIYEFAQTTPLEELKELLDLQIDYNMAMAYEGLKGHYGVGVGPVLLRGNPSADILTQIKAYTAAGSEARMSGCALPVITNSGSGNQGMASSIPVIVYAQRALHEEVRSEKLYRALLLSNLLTIHQKTPIGRLSAFCGVVSATCSSAAAITYLCGGTLEQIEMTIQNTLANTPGMICDGAKASCGAKIATALDAAYMGHLLAMSYKSYSAGDGVVKQHVENTISCIGTVARDGMRETEHCILNVMLN